MAWTLTVYSAVAFAVTALYVVLTVLGWRHRDDLCGREFTALNVAVGLWALSYGILLGFTTTAPQLLFWRITLAVSSLVPVTWFLFAARYAGANRWLEPRWLAVIALEPLSMAALSLTNSMHHLVFVPGTYAPGTDLLSIAFHAAFYGHVVVAYPIVAAGIAYVAAAGMRGGQLYRFQSAVLVLAALPAFFAHILFTLQLSPIPGLDTTPFAFAFTGVCFALALYHFDLLDRTPIARQRAIEEMGDGLVVLDAEGVVVDADETARTTLSPAPRPGMAAATVFDGRPLDAVDGTTVTATTADGDRAYDLHLATLHGPEGRDIGTAVTLRDVTDRHAYEQRLEVVNRVLRHNLRNDMNVIQGYAAGIVDGSTDDPIAAAEVILDTSTRLADLGEKARALARFTPGATGERVEVVSVSDRVLAAAREAHPDVAFEYDAPPRAEAVVIGPTALSVALQSLVENAVEHNDAAEPRISVGVSTNGERVCIAVADNGPGIPPVERAVLERGTETPVEHSQGLGLWLAYWCATVSGGDIGFEAPEGWGSVVALTFDAVPASPE